MRSSPPIVRSMGARFALFFLPLFVLSLVTAPLASPAGAFQATRSAAYDAFDVAVEVREDGSFRVTETTTVDFMTGSFSHGFGWIPTERSGGIDIVSVSELVDGEIVPYQEVIPDELGIWSGDELLDWDVTGEPRYAVQSIETPEPAVLVDWIFPEFAQGPTTRVFVLTYDVKDALRVYPDADPPYQEVWWTAIGEEVTAQTPVRSGSVTVTLPEPVPLDDVQASSNNDEHSPDDLTDDGQTFRWTFGEVETGEPYVIRLRIPPVADNAPVPAWQAADDEARAAEEREADRNAVIRLILLLSGIGIVIGGGLLLYGWWYVRGRDPHPGPAAGIATEPPSDLPAAVAGALIDEVVDERDLVAILFDLQRRGAIEITKVEDDKTRPVPTGPRDFTFTLKDPDVELPNHERLVLRSLFGYRAPVGTRASFRNQYSALQAAWPEVREALYQDLVQQGFVLKSPAQTRRRWRNAGVVVILLAIVFAIGGLILSQPLALFPGVAGAAIGAAMLYVSRHMPAKTRLGSEAAAQWRAFAEHLRSISFFRGNPEGRETLERYLPYTIALGIDREWLPRLAQASTPVSGWIDVVTHRLDTGDWPDSPSGGGWVGDLFSGWSGRSWPSGGSGEYRGGGGGGLPNVDLPNLPNAPDLPSGKGWQDVSSGASKGLNIASDDTAKLLMDVAGILLQVGFAALSGGKSGGGGGGGRGFN